MNRNGPEDAESLSRRARDAAPRERSRAPATKKKTDPLVNSTSDLVVPQTIMSWERELLLPVVGKLVADLVNAADEADAKETGTPSP